MTRRNAGQEILPLLKKEPGKGQYDIYPAFRLDDGLISTGYESLAERLESHKLITIDGYGGVFFEEFISNLRTLLLRNGHSVSVQLTCQHLKPAGELENLISPFTGGYDPLFGKRTTLELRDFFRDDIRTAVPDKKSDISIIAGPGAALAGWAGPVVYIDLPKNEIQYRARAGSITNLGFSSPANPATMYKIFYFVDWPVLNKHKQDMLGTVDVFIDSQRPGNPVWISGHDLREALSRMSRSPLRARPWFEPGTWGGTWIKDHIRGINSDVINYAWSFELISPENGLILESSSIMLEISFDCLMYLEAESVLGAGFKKYGTDFPIRFDFLDTFDGGNLSLQCHPRPDYIKEHFGELFTQEETYYILDNKEDPSVYLGFRHDIDPSAFKSALEESFRNNSEIDPEAFILRHPSEKHDLFLIPYGTIHGSGKNNLVLEISTTPYIFTFKMYDWLRPDLNGKPRPLNIERGMENLYFERKGGYVKDNLISKPVRLDSGNGWRLYELPTHESHSYRICRYHFSGEIELRTGNNCLVMSLVEGESVTVAAQNGTGQTFSYAETFIIPAAAGFVNIVNNSKAEAILVFAFVK